MSVSHKPWEVAEAILSVSRRVLLRGKPGTGKTFAARSYGLAEDQKVYQITMTPETPMAEIRGHFVQKGGEFIWHDGPAIRAWREGARLVINEIDRASEDVLSILYAIMDDPEFAELTLPTGETVRPSKGFGLVATMNGEPDDLPDALQDRLPVEIHITDLNPEALERLPERLREAAMNTALAPSEERSISIRMWMEFASLTEKLADREDGEILAAEAIFGERAQAALIALDIATTADPSIDMEGDEYTPNVLQFINEFYTGFAKWVDLMAISGYTPDITTKMVDDWLTDKKVEFKNTFPGETLVVEKLSNTTIELYLDGKYINKPSMIS